MKMTIKFTDAAKYYTAAQHQINAWNWLQTKVSPEVLNIFASKYRETINKKNSSENTWDGIYNSAKQAGAKYPECVAAQWALESSWGKHVSGKHNYFGLKGAGGSDCETSEFIDNKWITITDGFIDFDSIDNCVRYLVNRWYKDFKGYQGVNRALSRNECAELLISEGYATDPDYTKKLIQIMDQQTGTPGCNEDLIINDVVLDVPYEYQLDNKSGTGYRECFSSSCAMIAKYYGAVQSDDEYNSIRRKFGDSTEAVAQVQTLQSLGLKAKFITDGNSAILENEIRHGRPVAVGWLHHGSIARPEGGGHWTCLIGFDKDNFVHHDPNGDADMVNGGYINNESTAGCGICYSRKNWLKRWECDGNGTGWALLVSK
jgi:hypothetical protein